MQTEKFVEHFRNMGCTGPIEVVADDEALSGTMDIHNMPGMIKTIKSIEEESVGWIAAVHVNRLTRDKWLIKPSILMKKCFEHHVWIATLRTLFDFRDEYCQRVFMLEAEEAARHLEWMKLILGGGKRTASSKGYYDGRFVCPGYIVDRSDPLHKKYKPYPPHAEIVAWLFKRLLELDGNFSALCREVEQLPWLFPAFQREYFVSDEDFHMAESKFSLRRKKGNNRTPEGNYRVYRTGLISILTNPVYMGWWEPLDGGVIENNHEPIVDPILFAFAHSRLSTLALDGQRQKPVRERTSTDAEALLKGVLKGPVPGTGTYPNSHHQMYQCCEYGQRQRYRERFSIKISVLDKHFTTRMLERLRTWEGCDDWQDSIEKHLETLETKHALIRQQIKEIDTRLIEIDDTVNTPGCPKSLKLKCFEEYEGLEKKKAELYRQLTDKQEQSDEQLLFEISTLIPAILEKWESLSYATRKKIVFGLVRSVTVDHVAHSWWKLQIEWRRSDWGTDIGYFLYYPSGGHDWTAEEDEQLRQLYPFADAEEILQAFPQRNWTGLRNRALALGIRRERNTPNRIPVNNSKYAQVTYEDIQFAQEHNLVLGPKNVQWSRLLLPGTRGRMSAPWMSR